MSRMWDHPQAVDLDFYRTSGEFGEEIVLQLDCRYTGYWPDVSQHHRGFWLGFGHLHHPLGDQIVSPGRYSFYGMGVEEVLFCVGTLKQWRAREHFGAKSIRFPQNLKVQEQDLPENVRRHQVWPEGVKHRILCKFLTWGSEYDDDQLLNYAQEVCCFFEDTLAVNDLQPDQIPERFRQKARFNMAPKVFYRGEPFVIRSTMSDEPGGTDG